MASAGCSVCGVVLTLRKNGAYPRHRNLQLNGGPECEASGTWPEGTGWRDCVACLVFALDAERNDQPRLLETYHFRRHPELGWTP